MLKPFQEAYHKSHQNNSTTFTFTFIDDSSVQTFKKLTNAYFWKIVFADDEGGARIKKWGDDDVDFSLQFSHFIISANWGLYQIVMAILMLNVLIAIMNTTYAQMWEMIDVEWKFSKTCYKAQFLTPGSAFPPPFHLFYILARYVFRWKRLGLRGICCNRNARKEDAGSSSTLEKKKKYFLLLKKLLELKEHRDTTRTTAEKLADLRKDLFEKLTDKVNEMTKRAKNPTQQPDTSPLKN